jgi:pyruvate dehydrogenase E1 component beta subunit
MSFADAIDDALAQAMLADPRIIVLGEDVHTLRRNLYVRFGEKRVRPTPISEAGFVGAAVGSAMAGLHPVVEVMLIDFINVTMSALVNEAAKIEAFSGGKWHVPMVVRAACGGGYGDAGQHEQTLWGWLAHIPGLSVVAPATPADAGGLLLSATRYESPVVFLEHKLLSGYWLDYMGGASRTTVNFDIPSLGARGEVPDVWDSMPIGKSIVRRPGKDVTIVSLAVGVHRSLEAASILEKEEISAEVIDLRTVSPLDWATLLDSVRKTGHLMVVDEDYREFGLSGELAAGLLENGVSFKYGRVCTEATIPYCRQLEDKILPNANRIVEKARTILQG